MKTFAQFLEARRGVYLKSPEGNKPKEVVIGNIKLKLYKDNETNEFVVGWIENGKFSDEKSYYTHDMADAMGTMDLMARDLLSKQH